MREKVGKAQNTVFFQWFVAQEGRKVGSLKRRVRSQLATGAMKNCTPLWREAHFQVKRYKTPQVRTTFGSWDVEKVHAVVAWSTFVSEKAKNTSSSGHFWKLRCRKSARRCGAKHISKSKMLNTGGLGPLLEVQMSKKCTPLWREAHFEVKMYKTHHVRTIFGGSEVVSRFTLHSNTLHYTTTTTTTTLHDILLHYTPLHPTTLHCTQLHSITLHYITLHYTPLHYTTLHYTTLHHTTLHYTTLHYLPLPYITLHYTPLHYTTLHYTPLHYTSPTPTTTLHYTPLHHSTLHYTTLHWMTLHHR